VNKKSRKRYCKKEKGLWGSKWISRSKSSRSI